MIGNKIIGKAFLYRIVEKIWCKINTINIGFGRLDAKIGMNKLLILVHSSCNEKG